MQLLQSKVDTKTLGYRTVDEPRHIRRTECRLSNSHPVHNPYMNSVAKVPSQSGCGNGSGGSQM
jgi:hypothetical protein